MKLPVLLNFWTFKLVFFWFLIELSNSNKIYIIFVCQISIQATFTEFSSLFLHSILSFFSLSWTLQFSYQNTKTISKVFCLEGGNKTARYLGKHNILEHHTWDIFVFLPTTSLELRNNTHTLNSKTSSYVQSLELDGSNQLLTTHQELFLKFL